MTSLLIKHKCNEASWPLNAYTGQLSLQSRLYRSLPSGTVQNEVSGSIKVNYKRIHAIVLDYKKVLLTSSIC